MAKVIILRTRNNGKELQMKFVSERLVWFYLKRGWRTSEGQLV